MSVWLQEEIKEVEEYRKKKTPTFKSIIVAVVVIIAIEAALFIANQYTSDYNMLPLCKIVGFMGVLIIAIFALKSKTTPNKPKLPIAVNCIESLHLSSEELQQFDAEMMARPLVLIQDTARSDIYISITEHYIVSAFSIMGEKDYGIYRISDIAMTCYESAKSYSTVRPLNKGFDIDLLNAKGEMIGASLFIDGKKNFTQFNEALEKYAPDIRLNVPMKEVKNIRKMAGKAGTDNE